MKTQYDSSSPAPALVKRNFESKYGRGFIRNLGRNSGEQQQGVALIVSIILLLLVSLFTAAAIRNASSNEQVMGGVRTAELATQAAEAALRYCEDSVRKFGPVPILAVRSPPAWGVIDNWDSSSQSLAYTLPAVTLNQSQLGVTYQRLPECMVERLLPGEEIFVITARGFGPEVKALGSGVRTRRPLGAEIWLQSHIEFEKQNQ
ncbi:pilus assembly PilX family protein [Roseateles sp. GG27B]